MCFVESLIAMCQTLTRDGHTREGYSLINQIHLVTSLSCSLSLMNEIQWPELSDYSGNIMKSLLLLNRPASLISHHVPVLHYAQAA